MPHAVLDTPAKILGRELIGGKIHPLYSRTEPHTQFLDYKSDGSTRLTINGSRHYRTPYGELPSVTTILSATSGNQEALARWAKNNPGGREAAAARGTKVHSLMEEYLLGIEKDPVIDDEEIAAFWDGLPQNLDKLERVIWAERPASLDDFAWTVGGDGISRVWHPGVNKDKIWGFAGAPDIVAEYKGKTVLGDLKTSNGKYYAKWPGSETLKSEYGMKRAGYMKYSKCMKQLGAYSLALEHTIGIVPEIFMIFVATRDASQVFAVQGQTITKWQNKWLEDVEKYYSEILPALNQKEIDLEIVDGDNV